MDLDLNLLKRLCELPGAPGREERIRAFVREKLEPLCEEVSVDALGNLSVIEMCHKSNIEAAIRLLRAFIERAHTRSFTL